MGNQTHPPPQTTRSDQSLLGRRLQHIVHLQSRIAVLLCARTVRAACGALVARHHQEHGQRNAGDGQKGDHDRHYDDGDVGRWDALRFDGGLQQ